MLLKRKHTYYFRWQVPKDLRSHFGYELIRSLRTTNKIEALARMGSYAQIVNLIKETRRLMMLKEVTQENYSSVMESIKLSLENESITLGIYARTLSQPLSLDRELGVEMLYKHLCVAELNGMSLDQLITKKDPAQAALPALNSSSLSITRGQLRITTDLIKQSLSKKHVVNLIRSKGFETENDLIIEKFRRDYGIALIAQQDRKIDIMTGKTPAIEAYKRATPQISSEKEQVPVMLLSQFLADEFFQYKQSRIGGLSERAEKDYKIDFIKILAVMEDKPLNLYTKLDIRECLNKILLLPMKNKQPYNKMSYEQIFELGEIPEEDIVSLSTADHVKKKLQAIFNTAMDLEIVNKNPTDKLDWKRPSEGFGNYENEEVKVLFETAQKADGWKKWIVSIGALTGCRVSEVAHLRGKDLIKDEYTGIYYFNIKTDAGSLENSCSK
jgi:hypothetical protein